MAKTIVQRILAETRARLQQREGLDRVRSGSALGEPALLDELMRRFATEVAPMLSQLVAKELDRAFRSMPTPPSALALSPFGSEFAAPRPASDSEAIRNIADLFDPDAPDRDDEPPASGESDLEFPLDELKKQLESIMADTGFGSDVSIPASDSTELGTTLLSAASEKARDESDPGNHDDGLRPGEAAPTQQIPSDEIDQVRRESSNPFDSLETPSEETQQITTALDEFFRDPDDEERLGASGEEAVGLRDSAHPPGLVEDGDDHDESIRGEDDETDPRSPQDAPEDEGDTSVDSEAAQDASTSDDDTAPEAPGETDILEEIGISLERKVTEYWEENRQSGSSNEEIVLEFEEEETVPDEGEEVEETEVAELDSDPSPPEASDPESARETDALEGDDEVETQSLNLDSLSSGIREGPELEALQQQLRGLRNSDPPVATQTLELGDSRELGAVVRILQDSQDRLLATIERLAETLSSCVDERVDRVSQSVTGR